MVLIEDFNNNELRALVHLKGLGDRYLYVTREVDGTLFNLLDETQKTAVYINNLATEQPSFKFCGSLFCIGTFAYSFFSFICALVR